MSAPAKLGIIAGGGVWPSRLAKACGDQGRDCHIIALKEHCDEALLDGLPHTWVDIGAVGKVFSVLGSEGCAEVVLAGPIERPSLSSVKPDLRGMKLIPKLLKAGGDDGLLRVLVEEFESEGYRVVGIDDVVGGLLAAGGPIGRLAPDDVALGDIARGIEVARSLGALDVGQAVVVQQGHVLGVEAAEGTDRLLERCGELRREGAPGVLVKISKPGQERRADLPTIGVETVRAAASAGLAGIAVEANNVLITDRSAVAEAADKAGIFIIGIDAAES